MPHSVHHIAWQASVIALTTTEWSVVGQRLQAAQHGRGSIAIGEDVIDEARSGQMEHLSGNGRAFMAEQ